MFFLHFGKFYGILPYLMIFQSLSPDLSLILIFFFLGQEKSISDENNILEETGDQDVDINVEGPGK